MLRLLLVSNVKNNNLGMLSNMKAADSGSEGPVEFSLTLYAKSFDTTCLMPPDFVIKSCHYFIKIKLFVCISCFFCIICLKVVLMITDT